MGAQQNLLDVYQLALLHDPTWASARSANTAAQEKLVQGKALFRPTVSASINAGHSETDIQYIGTGGNPFRSGGPQHFNSAGFGFNINQPIFSKLYNAEYEQAKIQVTQADKQLVLAWQNLILRTSQAYFDVLLAQDKINLIQAQKSAINRQFEQAKANFDVGSATITDVNEAQARYDLTVAQEVAAINDFEVKKRAVQSVIGQLPQKFAHVRADLKTPLPEPHDMQSWVQIALQNNLNLGIQQQVYEFASQEVERQNAGHFPTLDGVANYNSNRAEGGINGFGSDLQNATIGLQIQIPIYQGGAVSSRVREAVANKQKAFEDVEVARRQAEFDTREAYLNVASSVAQVSAYEQALVSSRSQLDSTNLGYEVGVRTSVDVLNAQQQLFSAERDLLQARYSYLLNIIRLKSAAGLINEADLGDINKRLVANQTQPNQAQQGQTQDGVIITPLSQ